MLNLRQRLERLEAPVSGSDKPVYAVVIATPNEPHEAAVARYRAAHPAMPADAEVIIFVTGFTIAARDPLP